MANIKIEFDGLEKMLKKYERMEKDIKPAVNRALKESFGTVTPGIKAAIAPHRQTGRTEDAIYSSPDVQWNGYIGHVNVGFDLNNGGMASQYLIHGASASITGVPYRAPDRKLYESIFGQAISRRIREIQKKAFEEVLTK